MIAVQVADEDMVYLAFRNIEVADPHLSAFATIDQEKMLTYLEDLGSRKTSVSRSCPTYPEDGQDEIHGYPSALRSFSISPMMM